MMKNTRILFGITDFMSSVDNLASANDENAMNYFELMLLASVLWPMLASAALLNIFIGRAWEITSFSIGLFAITLSLSAFLLHYTAKSKIVYWVKLNVMGVLATTCLAVTFVVYFDRISILYWFILAIVTMTASLVSNPVFLGYISALNLVTFIVMLVQQNNQQLTLDTTFYVSMFVMIVFIQVVGYVINRFYATVLRKKSIQFMKVIEQKEEITSLYEEIVATEEELREQNEKLSLYNAEIIENRQRLEYLAYNDTLTGLPNRKMFYQQLDLLIDMNKDSRLPFAVVFIDLDDFKKINDSLGHAAGDMLLIDSVSRLSERIGEVDLLARLGGDEMALIIRRIHSNEAMYEHLQTLCNLFNEPFNLENHKVRVTASFGVAVWPVDAQSSEELVKAADTAMYKAKDMGKNSVQFYRKELKDEILQRIKMEHKLINAFENNEFSLDYQPIFDAKSKEIIGLEALLRWYSKDLGQVGPASFIPLAEEMGLIHKIGFWVLEEACKKLKSLQSKYDKPIYIAINVSTVQLKRNDFAKRSKAIISSAGIDPKCIQMEITESICIEDFEKAVSIVTSLKEIGVTIAMDDFGTGYSSLGYLLDLPLDTLKIDKSFIHSLDGKARNNLVGGIISMVHSLGMEVVAEGVETISQLEFLEGEHCDKIQGYLLCYPMSSEQMDEMLISQKKTMSAC